MVTIPTSRGKGFFFRSFSQARSPSQSKVISRVSASPSSHHKVHPKPHSYRLRLATRDDIPALARVNEATLPENYSNDYYLNQLIHWPQLTILCEREQNTSILNPAPPAPSSSGSAAGLSASRAHNPIPSAMPGWEVVGYTFGTAHWRLWGGLQTLLSTYTSPENSEAQPERVGHMSSLSVLPSHRGKGVAMALVSALHSQLQSQHNAVAITLHVRVSESCILHNISYHTHPSFFFFHSACLFLFVSDVKHFGC